MTSQAKTGTFTFQRIFEILISFSGIFGSYITNSYVGEKLLGKTFSSKLGKTDPIVFLITIQYFISYILALLINRVLYRRKTTLPIRDQIKMSSLGAFTTIASLKILNYLSSPVTNLIRSSKSLSILLVGLVFGKASMNKSQIISVGSLTTGILIFQFLQDENSDTEQKNTSFGYILAGLALIVDGLLAANQDSLRKKFNCTAYDFMEGLGLWGGLIVGLYGIVSGEFMSTLKTVLEDAEVLFDIGLMILTGVVGQIFIFYTIVRFSSLFLSIVTSSRKFFTVAISIFSFGHKVNMYQWIGILFVFGGVGMEVYQKAQEKPKAKDEMKNQ